MEIVECWSGSKEAKIPVIPIYHYSTLSVSKIKFQLNVFCSQTAEGAENAELSLFYIRFGLIFQYKN
jgi:hypothetical protein